VNLVHFGIAAFALYRFLPIEAARACFVSLILLTAIIGL
jgi:hypothetical protein